MKKIIFTVLTCMALTFCANAQSQKIATFSMRKAFDGYFKTKQADIAIKARAAEFDEEAKKFQEEYEKITKDYAAAQAKVDDPTISDDARAIRKKEAENILLEIKKLESTITQFRQSAQSTLMETQNRHRNNILKEITELVSKRAQKDGYTMVIDVGAMSADRSLVVIYSDGKNDITDDILKQLNANAPADILKQIQEEAEAENNEETKEKTE